MVEAGTGECLVASRTATLVIIKTGVRRSLQGGIFSIMVIRLEDPLRYLAGIDFVAASQAQVQDSSESLTS